LWIGGKQDIIICEAKVYEQAPTTTTEAPTTTTTESPTTTRTEASQQIPAEGQLVFALNFAGGQYNVLKGPAMQREGGVIEAKDTHNAALFIDGNSLANKPLLDVSIGQFGLNEFTIMMDVWHPSGQDVHIYGDCVYKPFYRGACMGTVWQQGFGSYARADKTITDTAMDTWATWTITRVGTSLHFYINGEKIATVSNNQHQEQNWPEFRIGYSNFKGWFDNIYVWHGVALEPEAQKQHGGA